MRITQLGKLRQTKTVETIRSILVTFICGAQDDGDTEDVTISIYKQQNKILIKNLLISD